MNNHLRIREEANHSVGVWAEGRLILALTLLPLALFVLLALIGFNDFDATAIFLGLVLGLPFWFVIVRPVHFISNEGKRWSLHLTVTLCFLALATYYVTISWSPDVHILIVGRKVLIVNGLPTALWYYDLFTSVVASGMAVLACTPIFQRHLRLRAYIGSLKTGK
ncbi:MAG: hypothetical protein V4488_06750 [Pseudomonadota bacterium]